MARTPVEAAEVQLKWYNERNVDEFLTVFSDDCVLQDLRTGEILATGKAEIRPRYEKRFSTPVHAKLVGRLNVGNVVTDQEHITGLPDGAEATVLAVYHVTPDGLINRVQFVWENVTKA
eukprot:CAMPEP_0196745722 /NCGR_PEP_ID=MMETSP1091-20130531/62915_1 /TAXON_ID=302021 /ORGANISM="Rhodomonas sp., Strain CCMP768" /LENGTH=118 /DNA_ID=CAMNT_0042092547 /DNA_START=110 /DNA_END=466 /DNA_ORIENTATION=-